MPFLHRPACDETSLMLLDEGELVGEKRGGHRPARAPLQIFQTDDKRPQLRGIEAGRVIAALKETRSSVTSFSITTAPIATATNDHPVPGSRPKYPTGLPNRSASQGM